MEKRISFAKIGDFFILIPMYFSGIVIHGKKLGRTIGYPTANIELAPGIVEDGVYALRIDFDNTAHTGM